MPPFDARAEKAALEPPVLIDLDGVTHTGRILSHDEYQVLKPDFVKWANGSFASDEEETAALGRLFAAIDIPMDKVLALPPELVTAALMDFFGPRRRKAAPAAP